MKKLLYLFVFLFTMTSVSFAQEEDDPGGKLREKMVEYIQTKLNLTKPEADKFQPIFLDYLKQLRSTKQEFRGDRLLLQQKIAELRLRYRDQFKPVIGEQRSNEVFRHEHDFVEKVKQEFKERKENRQGGSANKRTRTLLQ